MTNELIEPEIAVQKWRDQIEENRRLQQVIADRDAKIEELARLNHQVLFEANRYQALYTTAVDECGSWRNRAHALEAQLDAIGMVVQDAARSLDSISDTAFERVSKLPTPQPSAQPAMPQGPIEDEPFDPPVFLRTPAPAPNGRMHCTPLPAMEGIG